MGRKFSKYHGAGNDFVMIDGRTEPFDATPERVAALCRRRTGIGADGLMILESDPAEEFRMRYFNADGGEATMCGNGGRCIALFAHHLGIGGMRKRFIGVDGPHTAELLRVEGPEGEIRLGMIDVRRVEVHPEYLFLDTGSPHYVEFVESVRGVDVEGGTLRVAFEPDGKGGFTRIELTGPARKVFEGEFADDFRRDGEPEFPKKS